nr:sulfate adenylyltransferase subunit CysD [Rhizobium sp. 3T7]
MRQINDEEAVLNLIGDRVWNTELAFQYLKAVGMADTKRTAERRLHELGILPAALIAEDLRDEFGEKLIQSVLNSDLERQRSKRTLVLFVQIFERAQSACLHANDARGSRIWVPMATPVSSTEVETALRKLRKHVGKPIAVFPHAAVTRFCREIPSNEDIGVQLLSYSSPLSAAAPIHAASSMSDHLKRLESESIFIIREAYAEARNPVLLYSLGKDSSVLLHLVRKAFFPAPLPFPLLHVDTRWKFREMYQFRDSVRAKGGAELIVHVNPEAIEKDINPFDHGVELHTAITKTEGLKQALDLHRFDIVFGGARRDEEKSRAKERVFSFRARNHAWDPKNQRPEVWNLYNTRKGPDESIRVFPLSNWTELDIWQYIHEQAIPIVPLYFAKERPVVDRNGMLLVVDDDRMQLLPNEQISARKVRFRTLGCYPLTGAIESDASTVPEIIAELLQSRSSERQGRLIDTSSSSSMEKKKAEGYF